MLRTARHGGYKRVADTWRRNVLVPPFYRSTGSGIESGSATAHSAWPALIQTGDIVLCPIATLAGQPGTISTSGWTQIPWGPQDPSSGECLTIYWHRYVQGVSTLPTVNDSGDHQVSYIHAFGNCALSGDPFDAGAGSVDNTVDSDATCPDIITSLPLCLLLAFCSSGTDNNVSDGTFSAMTTSAASLVRGFDRISALGGGGGYGFYHGPMGNAGLAAGAAVTIASGATAKAMFSLALRPREVLFA